MRITKQMLYNKLAILNYHSRYQYDLIKDINGYQLVKINKGKGITSVSQILTNREMCYTIDSIINYLLIEEKY